MRLLSNGVSCGLLALSVSLVTCGLTCGANTAWGANLYLETTLFPSYESSNPEGFAITRGSTTSSTLQSRGGIGIDTRSTLGLVFGENWLIGGAFNYSSVPSNAGDEGTPSSIRQTVRRIEYGATVGYVNRTGFRLSFSYLFGGNRRASEISYASDGALETDMVFVQKFGSGYQVNIGYSFSLSSTLIVGPSLTYRNVTYDTQSLTFNGGSAGLASYPDTALLTKGKEAEFRPMLTIGFMF